MYVACLFCVLFGLLGWGFWVPFFPFYCFLASVLYTCCSMYIHVHCTCMVDLTDLQVAWDASELAVKYSIGPLHLCQVTKQVLIWEFITFLERGRGRDGEGEERERVFSLLGQWSIQLVWPHPLTCLKKTLTVRVTGLKFWVICVMDSLRSLVKLPSLPDWLSSAEVDLHENTCV